MITLKFPAPISHFDLNYPEVARGLRDISVGLVCAILPPISCKSSFLFNWDPLSEYRTVNPSISTIYHLFKKISFISISQCRSISLSSSYSENGTHNFRGILRGRERNIFRPLAPSPPLSLSLTHISQLSKKLHFDSIFFKRYVCIEILFVYFSPSSPKFVTFNEKWHEVGDSSIAQCPLS